MPTPVTLFVIVSGLLTRRGRGGVTPPSGTTPLVPSVTLVPSTGLVPQG